MSPRRFASPLAFRYLAQITWRFMTAEEVDIAARDEGPVALTGQQEAATTRIRQRVLTGENIAFVGLVLVLLVAAYFRFTGLNWDANHHLHPDERFLTEIASRLQPVSDPLAYLRTSESTLNPYNIDKPFYVYGNFPMTVLVYVANWVDQVCRFAGNLCAYNYAGYDGVHLVGRFFSGFVDLISILFIFLIGQRLYGWRAGLLGAFLLGVAVMPIQQSHFFTMDNWAAALCTIALYATVRASEDAGRKRWWLLFGLFLGLAVASRVNVAPLAAIAPIAGAIWLARREQHAAPGIGWRYINTARGSIDLQRVILGVLLAAIMSLVTFRLAQPYAFMDAAMVRETVLAETGRQPSSVRVTLQSLVGFNPNFISNMQEIQAQQSPEAAHPPALQWTARAPILFPLSNMVLYGMGLSAGLAAVLGFLWALWRTLRAHPEWIAHAIPVAWAGGYFLFMGTRWVKSIRYFLPIYPAFLLLAGWMLIEIWRRAGRSRLKRLAALLIILLAVAPALLWANAFVRGVYAQPMTRIEASHWMFDNIPTGATLLYEVDGHERELQLPLKGYRFQPDGFPLDLPFTVPEGGVLSGVRFNFLTLEGSQPATLNITLLDSSSQEVQSQETQITVSGERQQHTVDLSSRQLTAQQTYILRVEHSGGAALDADTSRIVNEAWDDLLPVSVDGKSAYGSYYSEVTGGQRPLPSPTTEEKRQMMLQWIDEADVIAISSQRSLWNTPRLPLSFPLNIAYYESLFNGELGFELVAEFHADLHVGPLYISDTGAELGWGAPPDIGWPPPGELAAEEAFSVYDHPPVWIFRKTDGYDSQRAQEILNAVDMSKVVHMTPGEATRLPNGLLLTPRERQIQRQHGDFIEVFRPDGLLSSRPWLGAAVWWLAVVLLGWLAFPLAFVALPGLPDRGFVLARILALLFVSWLAWFAASYNLILHNRLALVLSVVVLGLISIALYLVRRRQITAFLRRHIAYIGFVEGLGLLLFVFFIVVRLGNPDVWDVIWGGEKPMDLSYFTAVIKSSTFPPYDPWYAGGYINYYYYGFVFVGVLPELLGITPTVAYNIAIPMLFSFTGLGAFSLAFNLVAHLSDRKPQTADRTPGAQHLPSTVRRPSSAIRAGLTATAICVLLGNLGEVGVLLGAWQSASDSNISTGIGLIDAAVRTIDGAFEVTIGGQQAPIYPGDWFWTATRAININPGEAAPITEFPLFTFLYGDLHAHMIALPLTMLALGWAISLALFAHQGPDRRAQTADREIGSSLSANSATDAESSDPPSLADRGTAVRDLPSLLSLGFVGALSIGVLRPTNTWDWPTYLLLGSLAVTYYAFIRNHKRLDLPLIGRAVLQVAALTLFSTFLFWPYVSNYGAGYESLRLWDGSYTQVSNYLVIYGLFLFLILTHLAREWRAWTAAWTQEALLGARPWMPFILLGLVAYLLLIVALFFLNYWIAPIVLTPALLAGLLSLRPSLPPARRILLLLTAAGLALTLLVEIVVLEGDIGRMNTVFKFYMQVWILFSVVGGAGLALAWPAVKRRGQTFQRAWCTALVALTLAALLYPALAIPARWNVRMSDDAPTTLDGMAFMQTTHYEDAAYDGSSRTITLDGEYEALQWMQRHIRNSPVIVEAAPPDVGEAYRSIASRVAMYTGLPTIIGWDWHQTQQRAALPDNQVHRRMNDVARLYNTTELQEAMEIIRDYDVSYVYVGTQEALYYEPAGLEKFETMTAEGLLRQVFQNADVTIYEVIG